MKMQTRFQYLFRSLLVVLLSCLLYLPARAQDTDTPVEDLTLAKKLVEVETETASMAADQWRLSTYARLLGLLNEVYEEDGQTISTLTCDLYVTLQQQGRESSLEELMSAFHASARAELIREDQYAEVTDRYLKYRQENFSHGLTMNILFELGSGRGLPLLGN